MKEKPPYLVIAETIRENILAGTYAQGKVPSERALFRQYGVSRATATKALATLEHEGLGACDDEAGEVSLACPRKF